MNGALLSTPALKELWEWLSQEGCTSVAMESTGSYWIQIENDLEGSMEILLVSEKLIFGMPGVWRVCIAMGR